jgi:hypothetical protein
MSPILALLRDVPRKPDFISRTNPIQSDFRIPDFQRLGSTFDKFGDLNEVAGKFLPFPVLAVRG